MLELWGADKGIPLLEGWQPIPVPTIRRLKVGGGSSVSRVGAFAEDPIIPDPVQVVLWPAETPGLLEASDNTLSPRSCQSLSKQSRVLLFNAN